MGHTMQIRGDHEYILSDLRNGEVTFSYRQLGSRGWITHRGKISRRATALIHKYPGLIDTIFKSESMDEDIQLMPFQIIEFYIQGERPVYNGATIDLVDQGKKFGQYYRKTMNEYCRITKEYGNWKDKYRTTMNKATKRKPLSEWSINY